MGICVKNMHFFTISRYIFYRYKKLNALGYVRLCNLRFISSDTECLTGFEMLLFEASQVNNRPLSVRLRLSSITVDVTVEPDETSEDVPSGSPLCCHRTRGLGRPKIKFIRTISIRKLILVILVIRQILQGIFNLKIY